MPNDVNVASILSTKSTVTSSVNGRQFSVIDNPELDKLGNLFMFSHEILDNYKMQYAGQTGRALQQRFVEHYRRMNKPQKLIIFCIGTLNVKVTPLPAKILIQPVEKITYDVNSTSRF